MRKVIRKEFIILIIIILAGAFLRFYKLSEYPVQLNHDEISQLYDVKSIVETKKDVYGNFMPLAFPSTGDYKVGHYIYITTIPYLLFGNNESVVRIPAAFFGTLTVLAVFLFVKALTKNWRLACFCSAVIAITPSEIFYARKSFENVIGVSLELFGLFFLVKYLKEGQSKMKAFIGIALLSAAMYIYTSHTMITPLMLLLLFILFKEKLLKHKKTVLSLFLFWVIFIVPLAILTFTNPDLRFRAQTVFINQDQALGKVISLNGNNLKSYADFIPAKLLNQFDPSYLFLNGLDFTNKTPFGIGPMLVWQLPFLLTGIIYLIRKKDFSKERNFLLAAIVIAMLPSALTFEDLSPHRAVFSFTLLSIISGFGLFAAAEHILKSKSIFFKYFSFFIISASLAVNLLYFFRMYTINYPYEKSEKIQYPFKEISLYLWSQYNNYDAIVFDPKFGETAPYVGVGTHYYFAYYGNYQPAKFQEEYRTGDMPRETLFGKISIREIYWPQDRNLKNTLIIASPWSVPENDIEDKSRIVKRFYFYNGNPAFYAIKL